MKELKDKYRSADMFELARIFNATYDDVSVFGFIAFLNDNGYEIASYECHECEECDRDTRRDNQATWEWKIPTGENDG